MFCQQFSKAIIRDAQDTLVEAMAGWLNKCEGLRRWTHKFWGPRQVLGPEAPSQGRVGEERQLWQEKLKEGAGGHRASSFIQPQPLPLLALRPQPCSPVSDRGGGGRSLPSPGPEEREGYGAEGDSGGQSTASGLCALGGRLWSGH